MTNKTPRASKNSAPKIGGLIRTRRRQQNMTLQSFGALSGVSVGYLSQVERDQATPSLGTLAMMSKALKVGVEYFIATPSPQSAYTRDGQRTQFSVDGSLIVYEQLSTEFAGSELNSFLITMLPGYRSEIFKHQGEEFIYILEGQISQKVDDTIIIMKTGDSIHFSGSRPHSWWNETDLPAKLICTGNVKLLNTGRNKE